MIGLLMGASNPQYACKIDRKQRFALFTRGGMQAVAAEAAEGKVRVVYEYAPHKTTEEYCNPEQAAALVEAIMTRKQLCPVPKPD